MSKVGKGGKRAWKEAKKMSIEWTKHRAKEGIRKEITVGWMIRKPGERKNWRKDERKIVTYILHHFNVWQKTQPKIIMKKRYENRKFTKWYWITEQRHWSTYVIQKVQSWWLMTSVPFNRHSFYNARLVHAARSYDICLTTNINIPFYWELKTRPTSARFHALSHCYESDVLSNCSSVPQPDPTV